MRDQPFTYETPKSYTFGPNNNNYYEDTICHKMHRHHGKCEYVGINGARHYPPLKVFYMVVTAIVISMIVAFAIVFVVMKNSETAENATATSVFGPTAAPTEPALILYESIPLALLSNNHTVWKLDPLTHDLKQLAETKCTINAFDAYWKNERVIWSDSCLDSGLKWNNNNSVVMPHSRKLRPTSIAIDHLTGNAYIIDRVIGTLSVTDSSGKNHAILLSDLIDPKEIAVDSKEGLIFILQSTKSIVRVGMDGGSAKKIIEQKNISAMAIDRSSSSIYWSAGQDSDDVYRSDYEGKQTERQTRVDGRIQSLAVVGDQLFYIESRHRPEDDRSRSVLKSCPLLTEGCFNPTEIKLPSSDPISVKSHPSSHETRKNPCQSNNGDCDHLCLANGSGGHSCVCRLGWKLNSDSKSCSEATEVLVYIEGDYVKSKVIDDDTRVAKDRYSEFAWPARHGILPEAQYIDIDYDPMRERVFMSDRSRLLELSLNSELGVSVTHRVKNDNYTMNDVSLDWRNRFLYYIEHSRDSSSTATDAISMLSIVEDEYYEKAFFPLPFKSDFKGGVRAYSLVFDPKHKFVYFTAQDGGTYHVHRVNVDNYAPRSSRVSGDLMYYNTRKIIAVDYESDRLFWIHDSYDRRIRSSNMDGKAEMDVRVPVENAKYLSVVGAYLYVGNSTGVWRLDKWTGGDAFKVIPDHLNDDCCGEKIRAAQVFGQQLQL